MSSIVFGQNAGMSSGIANPLNASGTGIGSAGDRLFVNASTGNLIVQRQDQVQVSHGTDQALIRTYNSQGLLTADIDNTLFSFSQRLASPVASSATVTRYNQDGFQQTFNLDTGSTTKYTCVDDIGTNDKLVYGASEWVYTESSTGLKETYDTSGLLLKRVDRDGYAQYAIYETYGSGSTLKRLKYIVDDAFQFTKFDYTATDVADISKVSTFFVSSSGQTISTLVSSLRTTPGQTLTPVTGSSYTSTYYSYDSLKRLSMVWVDLSPYALESSSNPVMVTKYTYTTDTNSKWIKTIEQAEATCTGGVLATPSTWSTLVEFSYLTDGSANKKIDTMILGTGGNAQVTKFTYADKRTDVTSYIDYVFDSGTLTRTPTRTATASFHYDASGRLLKFEEAPDTFGRRYTTQFGYTNDVSATSITNTFGDPEHANKLAWVRDGDNNLTRYDYDSQGNLLAQMDGEGGATRWYYNAANQVISEVRHKLPDVNPLDDEFAPGEQQVTRYVYDSNGRLRFVINQDKKVVETRYVPDAFATLDANLERRIETYEYTNALTLPANNTWFSSLSSEILSTDTTLSGFVTSSATSSVKRSYTYLDFRGQIKRIEDFTNYGITDAASSIRQFVYDRNGRLLKTVDARALSSSASVGVGGQEKYSSDNISYSDQYETLYVYDGLGRVVATALALSPASLPNANSTETTSSNPNSLNITSTTDLASTSVIDANSGATAFNTLKQYEFNASTRQTTVTSINALRLKRVEIYSDTGVLLSATEVDLAKKAAGKASYELGTTTYLYDKNNQLRITIDPEGVLTHRIYDARGMLVGTVDGAGALTEYSYNAVGKVARTIQYANYLSASQLALLSRKDNTTNENNYLSLTPDIDDVRPTFSAEDRITHSIYDNANRLAYTIDGEGYVTLFQYNGMGELFNTIKHATPYDGYEALSQDGVVARQDRILDAKSFARAKYTTISPEGNPTVFTLSDAVTELAATRASASVSMSNAVTTPKTSVTDQSGSDLVGHKQTTKHGYLIEQNPDTGVMQLNNNASGEALESYLVTTNTADARYLDLAKYNRLETIVRNVDTGEICVVTTDLGYPSLYTGYVLLSDKGALADGLYEVTIVAKGEDTTPTKSFTTKYQVGTRYKYQHTLGVTLATNGYVESQSVELRYWKADLGLAKYVDPATGNATVETDFRATTTYTSSTGACSASLSDLVAGIYQFELIYSQKNGTGTAYKSTLSGSFMAGHEGGIPATHQYIAYVSTTVEGKKVDNYLTLTDANNKIYATSNLVSPPTAEITQLRAVVRARGTDIKLGEYITLRSSLSAAEKSSLTIAKGESLPFGEYDVDVYATYSGISGETQLRGLSFQVLDKLNADPASLLNTNTPQVLWDGSSDAVTVRLEQEENNLNGEYTELVISDVNADGKPDVTAYEKKHSTTPWKDITLTSDGPLDGYNLLALSSLKTTAQAEISGSIVNAGLQDESLNAYVDTQATLTHSTVVASNKYNHTLQWAAASHVEDFSQGAQAFNGVSALVKGQTAPTAYLDEGKLRLNTPGTATWSQVTGKRHYDTSAATGTFTYKFNSGRADYEGFLGLQSSAGNFFGLKIDASKGIKIINGTLDSAGSSLLAGGELFSASTDYTLTLTVTGANITLNLSGGTLNKTQSYTVTSSSDLMTTFAIKGNYDDIGNPLTITRVEEKGHQTSQQVQLQYRKAGDSTWQTLSAAAITKQSGANAYSALISALPATTNTAYEFKLQEANANGASLRTLSGSTVPTTTQTSTTTGSGSVMDYRTTTAAGTQIDHFFTSSEAANLAYVVTQIVKDAVVVDTVTTWASAFDAYQGQLLLGNNAVLANGNYTLNVSAYSKTGSLQTFNNIAYAINRDANVSQTVTWKLQGSAVDVSQIAFQYRLKGSQEIYRSTPVTWNASTQEYSASLSGVAGSEIDYVILTKTSNGLVSDNVTGNLTLGSQTGTVIDKVFSIKELLGFSTHTVTAALTSKTTSVTTTFDYALENAIGADGSLRLSLGSALAPDRYSLQLKLAGVNYGAATDIRVGDEQVSALSVTGLTATDKPTQTNRITISDIETAYVIKYLGTNGKVSTVEIGKRNEKNSVTIDNLNNGRYAIGVEYADKTRFDSTLSSQAALLDITSEQLDKYFGFSKIGWITAETVADIVPKTVDASTEVDFVSNARLSEVSSSQTMQVGYLVMGTYYSAMPVYSSKIDYMTAYLNPKNVYSQLAYLPDYDATVSIGSDFTSTVGEGITRLFYWKPQGDSFSEPPTSIGLQWASVMLTQELISAGVISTTYYDALVEKPVAEIQDNVDGTVNFWGFSEAHDQIVIDNASLTGSGAAKYSEWVNTYDLVYYDYYSLGWTYSNRSSPTSVMSVEYGKASKVEFSGLSIESPRNISFSTSISAIDINGSGVPQNTNNVPISNNGSYTFKFDNNIYEYYADIAAKDEYGLVVGGFSSNLVVEKEYTLAQGNKDYVYNLHSIDKTPATNVNSINVASDSTLKDALNTDNVPFVSVVLKHGNNTLSSTSAKSVYDNSGVAHSATGTIVPLYRMDNRSSWDGTLNLLDDADITRLRNDPLLSKYIDSNGLLKGDYEYTVEITPYGKNGTITPHLEGNVSLNAYTRKLYVTPPTHERRTPTLRWRDAAAAGSIARVRIKESGPSTTYGTWMTYDAAADGSDATADDSGLFSVKLSTLAKFADDPGGYPAAKNYDFEIIYTDAQTGKELSSATGTFTANYGNDDVVITSTFTRTHHDREERVRYDAAGNPVIRLLADGGLEEYRYDGGGRLLHRVQYDAVVTDEKQLQNTALMTLLPTYKASTLPILHTFSFYDGQDRLVAEVNAARELTAYSYNTAGLRASMTKYAGLVSESYFNTLIANDGVGITVSNLTANLVASTQSNQISQYEYDALGNLAAEINAESSRTEYGYNALGQVQAIISGLNATVSNIASDYIAEKRYTQRTYDAKGRLVGEAIGTQRWLHEYDNNDRRISSTLLSAAQGSSADATERKTRFFYDADGRLVFSMGPDHALVETLYDALGNIIGTHRYAAFIQDSAVDIEQLSGGLASAALVQYLRGFRSEKDSRVDHFYDRRGLVRATLDAMSYRQDSEYNAFGELSRVKRYISGGALTGQTAVTDYMYDKRGRVMVESKDALNLRQNSSFAYDAFGRVKTQWDANGNETDFTYDNRGRVLEVKKITADYGDVITSTHYDAFGRVDRYIDANHNETTYKYSDTARSVITEYAEADVVGTQTKTSVTDLHNRHGETSTSVDATGLITTTTYNSEGRVSLLTRTSSKDATKTKTIESRSYYASGLLYSVTDGTGNVTVFTYDDAQRISSKTVDPSGVNQLTEYSYDAQGQQVTETRWITNKADAQARRVVTTTDYDLKGRALQIAVEDDSHSDQVVALTSFTYDDLGNTLTVSQGGEAVSTFEEIPEGEPNAGGLVRLFTPPLTSTRYAYDTLGRRISETVDPSYYDEDTGELLYQGQNLTTSWRYDQNGNMVERTAPNGYVTYFYSDALGRERFVVNANGEVTETVYDAQGNRLRVIKYGTLVNRAGLEDSGGQNDVIFKSRLVVDNASDQITQFVYDDLHRLIYVVDSAGQVTESRYDNAGRVIGTVRHAGLLPLTVTGQVSVITSTGDAAVKAVRDQLASSYSDALSGATYSDQITRVIYDGFGRRQFDVDSLGFVIEYTYNNAGQLIKREQMASAIVDYDPVVTTDSAISTAATNSRNATNNRLEFYEYDGAGRQIYQVDAEGYLSQTVYDQAGRAIQSRRFAAKVNTAGLELLTTSGIEKAKLGTYIATFESQYAAAVSGGTLSTFTAFIQTSTAYDNANRVTSVTDALGHTEAYEYDVAGNKVAMVNKLGARWQYRYDFAGRLKEEITPQVSQTRNFNVSWSQSFDTDAVGFDGGLITTAGATERKSSEKAWLIHSGLTTPANGTKLLAQTRNQASLSSTNQQWLVEFEPRGTLPTGEHFIGLGSTVSPYVGAYLSYSENGFVVKVGATTTALLDAEGKQLSAQLDQRYVVHFVSKTTDGVSETITVLLYAKNGDTQTKLASATVTRSLQSGFGTLDIGVVTQDKKTSDLMIFDIKQMTEGTSTTQSFAFTTQDSVKTRYTYDTFGNLASLTEAADTYEERVTQFLYDRLGRQYRTTHPQVGYYTEDRDISGSKKFNSLERTEFTTSPVEETYYDIYGNQVASVDALGNYSYKVYDRANRLVYELDKEGYVTRYSYNTQSNTVAVTRYAEAFSATELTTYKIIGAFVISKSTMDSMLATLLVRGSSATTRSNDPLNRTILNYYDRLGQKTVVKEPEVYNYSFSSDEVFSLRKSYLLTRFYYDAFGNVTRQDKGEYYLSGTTEKNVNRVYTYKYYDKLGRVRATFDENRYVTRFDYDAHGSLLRQVEFAKQSAKSNSFMTVSWETISADTLLDDTQQPKAAPSASSTERDGGFDRDMEYRYDVLGRRIAEVRKNFVADSVSMSEGSLRTVTTGRSFNSERIESEMEYDALGNLVTVFGAKVDGVLRSVTRTYYDVLGRVIAVVEPEREMLVKDTPERIVIYQENKGATKDSFLKWRIPQLAGINTASIVLATRAKGSTSSYVESAVEIAGEFAKVRVDTWTTDSYEYEIRMRHVDETSQRVYASGDLDIVTSRYDKTTKNPVWINVKDTAVEIGIYGSNLIKTGGGSAISVFLNGTQASGTWVDATTGSKRITFKITDSKWLARGNYTYQIKDRDNKIVSEGVYQVTQTNGQENTTHGTTNVGNLMFSSYQSEVVFENQLYYNSTKRGQHWDASNKFSVKWPSVSQLGSGSVVWEMQLEWVNASGETYVASYDSSQFDADGEPNTEIYSPGSSFKISRRNAMNIKMNAAGDGLDFYHATQMKDYNSKCRVERVVSFKLKKTLSDGKVLTIIDGDPNASVKKMEVMAPTLAESVTTIQLKYRAKGTATSAPTTLEISKGESAAWEYATLNRENGGWFSADAAGIPDGVYEYELWNGTTQIKTSKWSDNKSYFNLGEVASLSKIKSGESQVVAPLTSFSYDALGNKAQMKRYSGGANVVELGLGELVANLDANSDQTSSWNYDAHGRQTLSRNGEGATSYFSYDVAGRVRKAWQPDKVLNTSYDGNATTYTFGTVYRYDRNGNIVFNIGLNPLLSTTASRRITGDVNGLAITRMSYNAFGEMTARGLVKDTELTTTSSVLQEKFEYDNAGRITRTNGDTGVYRINFYDIFGRLTKEVTENGVDTNQNLSTLADLTQTTNYLTTANGYTHSTARITEYVYDYRGNVKEKRMPQFNYVDGQSKTQLVPTSSPTTKQTFDRWGNVLTLVTPDNYARKYRYNHLNKLVYENELEGQPALTLWIQNDAASDAVTSKSATTEKLFEKQYWYNTTGGMMASEDANKRKKGWLLDASNQVVAAIAADGGTSYNAIDALNRKRAETNALGYSNWLRYDRNNRLIAQHSASGGEMQYVYDARGNRISERLRLSGTSDDASNFLITSYRFDGQNKIVGSKVGSATKTSYEVNEKGQRVMENNAYHSQEWVFDYFNRKISQVDLGAVSSSFTYDRAGQLTSSKHNGDRTVTVSANGRYIIAAQKTTYSYFGNGLLKTKTVQPANSTSSGISSAYLYDWMGRQRYETTTYTSYVYGSNSSFTGTIENETVYDALGRISKVTASSAQLSGYGITLEYEYDAVGNRRHVTEKQGATLASELWYAYDAENRMRVSQGTKNASNVIEVDSTNKKGVKLSYDLAGNRLTSRRYITRTSGTNASQTAEITESFLYDADNRHLATLSGKVGATGQYVSQKYYDLAGRTKYQFNYDYYTSIYGNPDGKPKELISYSYNTDGRLSKQKTHQAKGLVQQTKSSPVQSDGGGELWRYLDANNAITVSDADRLNTELTYTYNDDATTKNYTMVQKIRDAVSNQVTTTITDTISYYYSDFEQSKVTEITGTRVGGPGYIPGQVTHTYDGSGNLIQTRDKEEVSKNKAFLTNIQGEFIRKITNPGSSEKIEDNYYALGKGVASKGGERGTDIDFNFTPINDSYPASSPSTYTVSESTETLDSIALAVWGDASLWYVLADANALSAGSALPQGQILQVPNKVTNVRNAVDTFKPYNPAEIIGDTSPTMPAVPPPKGDDGCGAAQIIIVAVVVVATIFTAGAAAVGFGAVGATTATGFAATMSLGASVMAGGLASGWAALGIGMMAGAAGSIAGQMAGMAMGVQDEFDWNQVGKGAVTGGFTAGAGSVLKGLAVAEEAGWMNRAAGVISKDNWLKAGYSAVVNYGANKAAGNDVSFSWREMAVNIVAAGAVNSGSNFAFGEAGENVAVNLLRDTLESTATGVLSREILRPYTKGGKVETVTIAANAFGQAIGNSIVDAAVRYDDIEQFKEKLRTSMTDKAMGNKNALSASAGPGASPASNPDVETMGTILELLERKSFDASDELIDFLNGRADGLIERGAKFQDWLDEGKSATTLRGMENDNIASYAGMGAGFIRTLADLAKAGQLTTDLVIGLSDNFFGDGKSQYTDRAFAQIAEGVNGITNIGDAANALVALGKAAYASNDNRAIGELEALKTQIQLSAGIGLVFENYAPVLGARIAGTIDKVTSSLPSSVASISNYTRRAFGLVPNNIDLTYPVETKLNTAYFWSGKTDGVGGEAVARRIATENKGTTLEALIESRNIEMPKWDANNPDVVKAWKAISADYAAGASGTVRAVIGKNLRQGNVWETAELPALIKNPKVDRIITIDPNTKVETEILMRAK